MACMFEATLFTSPESLTCKQIVGILADATTFFGGYLLVREALRKEADFRDTDALKGTVRRLAGLPMEEKKSGEPLNNETDADLIEIRRTVKRARRGILIITVGFFLQLVSRIFFE